MATHITDDCINCGVCVPECPNSAIYEGGEKWEDAQGQKHDALSGQLYYIVPEKCTECVGFFGEEQCQVVCPVDCCLPDPDIPETEEVLLERAIALHPGAEIPDPPPSRFRN